MSPIHQVWSNNLHSQLTSLKNHLLHFPIVSIDTEFPGFLCTTPWRATEQECYEDVRFNVTNLKLIQLGLTLFNANGIIGGTWEFNFSDFDPEYDIHIAQSISLLIENGLDFQKLKKDGIAMRDFSSKFVPIINNCLISKFVTFHGIYDIAYFLKAISSPHFPATVVEFADWAGFVLGDISDLKHMARFCRGLKNRNLGLERLAELMKVKRFGQKHQAGSDSLLTAAIYIKMKQRFILDHPNLEGYLYGVRRRIAKIVTFISCAGVFMPVYYHPYYWTPPCTCQPPYYFL